MLLILVKFCTLSKTNGIFKDDTVININNFEILASYFAWFTKYMNKFQSEWTHFILVIMFWNLISENQNPISGEKDAMLYMVGMEVKYQNRFNVL